jgi:hypothetical protein
MIGRNELAEAARYNDAISEERGFEGWARSYDVDPEGLQYIAEQRALRVAMLIDGIDPRKMSRTEMTHVALTPEVRELMTSLTALAMDGIGIGLAARRQS